MNTSYPEFGLEPPKKNFFANLYDRYPMLFLSSFPIILCLCAVAGMSNSESKNVESSKHTQLGPVFEYNDPNTNLDLLCINTNNPATDGYNEGLPTVRNTSEGIRMIRQEVPENLLPPDWAKKVLIDMFLEDTNGKTRFIDPNSPEEMNTTIWNKTLICEAANVGQLQGYLAENMPGPAQTPTPLTP